MIKVMQKAVDKIAEEWIDQKFAEVFPETSYDGYGRKGDKNQKIKRLIENLAEVETRKLIKEKLENTDIDLDKVVLEYLEKNKDKIKVNVGIGGY